MDDRIEKSVSTFHNPYSCAQAVHAAFKDTDNQMLEYLKSNSGGRCASGECGALFATKLLTDESNHAQIEKEFEQLVGGTKCRLIKTVSKTPCQQCVFHAATLASKYLK